MKLIQLVLVSLCAASTVAASSGRLFQEAQDSGEVSLTRVPYAEDFDAEATARSLRSTELSVRGTAYERVLGLAVRSAEVRQAVEAWTDSEDVELAWTAQLLLRELDSRMPSEGFWRSRERFGDRGISPFGFRTWDQGELFRRMEELFQQPFGTGGKDWLRMSPWQGLDEAREQSKFESLSVEVGPDGVRVRVSDKENGDGQEETYEAESMEALLEAHPELRDRIDTRLHNPFERMPFGGDEILDPFRRSHRGWFAHPFGSTAPEIRTDVLGVRVRVSGDQAKAAGLTVVEVLSGSLAEVMGIQVGETIVSINDTEVHSVQDVKRVLAERDPEDPIDVGTIAPNGLDRTLTWKPNRALRVF